MRVLPERSGLAIIGHRHLPRMSSASVARAWADICVPPARGQGRPVRHAIGVVVQGACRVLVGAASATATARSPECRSAASAATEAYSLIRSAESATARAGSGGCTTAEHRISPLPPIQWWRRKSKISSREEEGWVWKIQSVTRIRLKATMRFL